MNKCFVFIYIFIGLLVGSSCAEKSPYPKPDVLLSEDAYLSIFYELELLRMYQNNGAPAAKTDSLYTAIFEYHQVEPALFDTTHKYFQTQVDDQQIRVDTVLKWLNRDLKNITKFDSLLTAQDSLANEKQL